ncbi:MAG: hypothetical protein IIX45_07980, partial [Lachnospiraceae bacterium]|nr:hypothetical protein [Lachnospiraceae bacterium]
MNEEHCRELREVLPTDYEKIKAYFKLRKPITCENVITDCYMWKDYYDTRYYINQYVDTEDITFTYCTEFIIQRENDLDPEKLRDFLSSLGDSLVLVDDEEIIKVHVHTNDPGKALHEAMDYG